MNEELQKQLAEMLARLMDVASDGAKWAGQQIPPLVEEKILLGRVELTLVVVVGLIACPLLARVALRKFRLAKEIDHLKDERYKRDEEQTAEALGIASSIGAVFAGLGAAFTVHDMLLVWFAPRLYIVDWLRTLVN